MPHQSKSGLPRAAFSLAVLTGGAILLQFIQPLQALLAVSFKLAELPGTTQRVLVIQDAQGVAHAAVQARNFYAAHTDWAGYLLGLVCTRPDMRHRGLASAGIAALLQSLDQRLGQFVVLNRGAPVTPFYYNLGFKKLAERAAYQRGGRPEIDNDPALGKSLADHFDLEPLRADVFRIGEDF